MIITLDADPYPYTFDPATTAFVVIDMQRDFVEPGGFGESLGNDVVAARAVVPPLRRAARRSPGRRPDGHPHPRGPPAGPLRPARPPS